MTGTAATVAARSATWRVVVTIMRGARSLSQVHRDHVREVSQYLCLPSKLVQDSGVNDL
jgi:hypothetical protein